jgi:hypothetical protein
MLVLLVRPGNSRGAVWCPGGPLRVPVRRLACWCGPEVAGTPFKFAVVGVVAVVEARPWCVVAG